MRAAGDTGVQMRSDEVPLSLPCLSLFLSVQVEENCFLSLLSLSLKVEVPLSLLCGELLSLSLSFSPGRVEILSLPFSLFAVWRTAPLSSGRGELLSLSLSLVR